MSTRLVILAGKVSEARYFCSEHDIRWTDFVARHAALYVSRVSELYGLNDIKFIIYGTFWSRSDCVEIADVARTRARSEQIDANEFASLVKLEIKKRGGSVSHD